jgi:hypothetical protein
LFESVGEPDAAGVVPVEPVDAGPPVVPVAELGMGCPVGVGWNPLAGINGVFVALASGYGEDVYS